MTQEEKAKAYDKALERARVFNDGGKTDIEKGTTLCEYIFPELKESEDERIRNAIIKYLDALDDDEIRYGVSFKDMRVWLEKQGEQKSVDNVEPKFHEGDFIVNKEGNVYKVVGVCDIVENEYRLRRLSDNGFIRASISVVDKRCHFWNITEDAKDGEVLAEDTFIFIIKKLNHDHTAEIYCCLFDDGNFGLNSDLILYDTCTYPATKEQRDLLFAKMKEAGYEWDAEKKELNKIEQKPTAWSEEDEINYDYALAACIYYGKAKGYTDTETHQKTIDWLKDRVQPQPKQEWSEEDIKRYISCLQRLGTGNPYQPETVNSKWFKEHCYKPYNLKKFIE